MIEKAGVRSSGSSLPHKAFHRQIGTLAGISMSPGRPGGERGRMEGARGDEWLPSDADRAFVASLMGRVVEPGKFANWIAPPAIGINRQPVDFEYVRFG